MIASLVYRFVLRDDSIFMESTPPSPASPRGIKSAYRGMDGWMNSYTRADALASMGVHVAIYKTVERNGWGAYALERSFFLCNLVVHH